MVRRMNLVFGFFLMVGLFACSRSLVKSDFDREINFGDFKTYDWMTESEKSSQNGLVRNTLFEKRLRSAVDKGLEAKGFQKQTKRPDFLIAYYITVMDKLEVSSTDYGYHPGYYRFGYWSRYYALGYYPRSIDVRQYKEGTLILDFVDPSSMKLLWRGWQTRMVDEGGIKMKEINEAVKQILRQFPPK